MPLNGQLTASRAPIRIWGSELSPYSLKLCALCDAAQTSYRMLPETGSRWQNLAAAMQIEIAKRRRTAIRYPRLSDLDEYPLVPYLLSGRHVYYDSSALAHWLDDQAAARAEPLVPKEPALAFAAQLIDEAFDEFGLYMVHHNRWVTSAATNDAGRRLAREFFRILPPGSGDRYGRRFAARQVRRLPYLFSVAPSGYRVEGLPDSLTPPTRRGFPPTHRQLGHAWEGYLDGVESVIREQPFLLGERFTLADASVYGQLGMNLKDPSAAAIMQRLAPATYRWLCAIRDGQHVGRTGPLTLSIRLRGLLDIISRTFVPLMEQNAAAFDCARASGEQLFNERAFNRGRALYQGSLLGQPFRSVVKTFQVRVWRELLDAWSKLDEEARNQLRRVLSPGGAFS